VTPDVVVDIGNTRMKFGLCGAKGIRVIATPPLLPGGDASQIAQEFGLTGRVRWAVAGVEPQRQAEFVAWAHGRGDDVMVIENRSQLPLIVAVEAPEQVGIDRLLGAVGANLRRTSGVPAVVVDAGSAITVNVIDGEGVFRGGSIAPGLGLMARALNTFTAKLPLVSPELLLLGPPAFPAGNTREAILCGLWATAVGGVRERIANMFTSDPRTELFITGGDAAILAAALADLKPRHIPSLTLEGIRIAAETLP
jgi:type III pantothenate kinase